MTQGQEKLYNIIVSQSYAFFKFNYSGDTDYFLVQDEDHTLRLAHKVPKRIAANGSISDYDFGKAFKVVKTDPNNFGFQLFASEGGTCNVVDLERYGYAKEVKFPTSGLCPVVKSGDWYKVERGGSPATFYIQPNCTLKDGDGNIVQMANTFWNIGARWLNALPSDKKKDDSWIPYINWIYPDGHNNNAQEA